MVKVPKIEETMIKCICNACPSYTECMKTGDLGLFCSIGDVKQCFMDLEGCNCQECSISSQYSFDTEYHCKDGSAEMQSK